MIRSVLLLGIIILMSICSCEFSGDLSYDYKYPGDKLVVHALISPDTGVFAIITRTVSPEHTSSNDNVDNPIVTLYENETPLFQLEKVDSMLYVSPNSFTPKNDVLYKILVSALGFRSVSSNFQTIPETIKLDSLFYKQPDNSANPYLMITVWFTDPIENANYYFIEYSAFKNGVNQNSRPMTFGTIPISDYSFKGQSHSEANQIDLYGGRIDSVIVTLYSISSDFSKFLKSMDDYDFSNQDPFYLRPSTVFSNINGGYGIFGAYSSNTKTVIIL